MAKIEWVVETSLGTVTHSGPEISQVQMDRLLDYVWASYPQLEPDGTPKARDNATMIDAVNAWGAAQWRGTKANVMRWESDAAMQAARDGVADLA